MYKLLIILFFNMSLVADQIYCYVNNADRKICITNNIIIKTDKENRITTITDKYNLHCLKTLSPNLYLLQTSDAKQVPKIVSEIAQETGVVYAQPDYVKKHLSR